MAARIQHRFHSRRSNPKTIAIVANKLAETYVLSTREAQSAPNRRAAVNGCTASQIDGLRHKVSTSKCAVETFRAEAGLLRPEHFGYRRKFLS